MSVRMLTIQDRVADHPALDALARLNAKVERALYSELQKGRSFTGDLAKTFYQDFGISAANLSYIHVTLQGRINSLCESYRDNVETFSGKIAAKERDIARQLARRKLSKNNLTKEREKDNPDTAVIARLVEQRDKASWALHQQRRRLSRLRHLLTEADACLSNPTLCFGSRELLRDRSLIDNEDAGQIAEWRSKWDLRRHHEIFITGSARKPCGNEFVRLETVENGWNLILRLPAALRHLADRIGVSGGSEIREAILGVIRFPHGRNALHHVLEAHSEGRSTPISWRIQRHKHSGWAVSCTLQEELPTLAVPDFAYGALGVDLNADHLAIALTDERGCFVRTWSLPFDTRQGSSKRNLDAARKAALEIARIALRHHVPVVIERLDFSKKKAEVTHYTGRAYANMLHTLGYTVFGKALDSACARKGVLLRRVNPAYTSIIGFACYAKPCGVGPHHAAAVAIARRGQRFSERVPAQVSIRLAAGAHGTLDRPERIGRRHVWTQWAVIARQRKASIRSFIRERAATSSGGDRKIPKAGRCRSIGSAGAIPSPAVTGLWAAAAEGAYLEASQGHLEITIFKMPNNPEASADRISSSYMSST